MKYFSYSKAYAEFRTMIEKERAFFMQNGLSKEETELIIDYTTDQFKRDCVYNSHNIAIGCTERKCDFIVTKHNFNYKRPKKKSDDVGVGWIETLQNAKLKAYLRSLSDTEIQVLTGITVNGKTRIYLAESLGISRQTISKIHKRILAELQSLNLMDED